ncbi:MAG: phosphoribosylanthranilate isomerase [Alphaproteobacteria bacterium]|nr:phosphoribosylanthranilate isomerase [Alphaproteobacteria bacterium]
MSRIAIKICGLSTPETLDAAIKAGASHIGMVFFAKSPRHIDFDRAAALAARVPGHIRRVGVFVDPDEELLQRAISSGDLHAIQLHGKETPERTAAIRTKYGRDIWKAISVKTRADLGTGLAYISAADMLLYDAKTPEGAALPGGMGVRFDWKLLQDFRHPLPWGLSGGLDANNVRDAIAITDAPLVDVSSGVESAPGIKDVDKVAAFCQAVSQL